MRLQRNSGSVAAETALFAGMIGVVATVLAMVVLSKGLVVAVMFGGAVAVVVFVAMWLMMRTTLEPARGPGNIVPNKTAYKPGAVVDKPAAPKAKAATAKTSTTKAAPAKAAKAKAAPAPQAAPKAAATAEDTVGTPPPTLKAARGGKPDDLKEIKGVGPKLEETLHSMGFYHFDQIAAWSEDEVAWADENLVGFKGRVTRDEWVAQAKDLAKGAS